jgi:O-antigen/teichoic acid export membrane protein
MVLTIKKIFNNKKLIFSVVSQLITLIVGIIMTVGVTKFISVEDYGYWQLFIFYCSYLGLAHLGICDGLYLVYGGKKISDIDKNELKGIFTVFILIQLIIGIGIFTYSTFFEPIFQRRLILQIISFLLLISNSQIFFGYILLATDNIVQYSKSTFIEKMLLLCLIVIGIALDKTSLQLLIIFFVFSKIISLSYLLTFYKKVFLQKIKMKNESLINLIKIGGTLMISNIVSTLILGVGRYFIDKNWDIEVFGKISLAISLVYFVLVLLAQISFLLFPYLRNSSDENQKIIFVKLNKLISLMLKISIILYFPSIFVLKYFLPNYLESIHYLILLLPLCLYDGKMQILYASYFKNLFLQKKLLIINIISFTISFIASFVGSYILKDLNVILLGIVLSIVLRSIISEILLQKTYNIRDTSAIIFELLFASIIIIYFFQNFNIYALLGSLIIISVLSYFKKPLLNL